MEDNHVARVHRFRDKVAVHIGTGETVYLTPEQAGKLAKALNACKRDVKARSFVDHEFITTEIV